MTEKSTVQQTVEALLAFIQRERIEEGMRLPSERRLAEELGVTRGQVRNAVKQLEHQHMLEVLPQVGIVLRGTSPASTMFAQAMNLDNVDLQSLIELRVSLEVTAAGLAARRSTPEDLNTLETVAEKYDRTIREQAPWNDDNIAFHMAVIKASHNGAVIAVMENLLNDAGIVSSAGCQARQKNCMNHSIAEHSAVLEAIKNRDEAAAMKAMAFHLRKMSDIAEKLADVMD